MRVLALLAVVAVALSGCTLPEEETQDPLFGVCPQWIPGPWNATVEAGPGEQVLTPDPLELDGRPVDRYRIRFDAFAPNGTVQLRAYAEGRQIGIYDFRAPEVQVLPVLTLDAAEQAVGHEFDVILSDVAHGSEPAPSPLRLEWSGDFAATVTVTAHYRVCGAPV